MSNGSAAILFLNPCNFKVTHYIVVEDAYSEVGFLNELQYVDGEIYANVWKTDYLVRFSAKTGESHGLGRSLPEPGPDRARQSSCAERHCL